MVLRIYSEIVERAVKQFGEKTSMLIKRGDSYRSWSFNEFHDQLNRTAEALRQCGFSESSNGIVIGANTPEWIIAYHAIFLAGKCTVPVDPNLPIDELEEILVQSEAEVVFCDIAYLPLYERLMEKHTFLNKVVILSGKNPENSEIPSFDNFLAEGENIPSAFERSFKPDDPMAILFTSGTTGKSKGAVLTQKNYSVAAEFGFDMMGAVKEDRLMAVLPLYHVFGFAAIISGGMMNGVDVIFIPEIKGPAIVAAMNDLGITALPAVPQMLTLMLENIMRGVDRKGFVMKKVFQLMLFISRLLFPVLGRPFQRKLFSAVHAGFGGKFKIIISGGASLDQKSFSIYQALGFDIVEGYGLTETFGPITLCPITHQKQGSVGKIMGNNEMQIFNPDNEGWGEVLFRGDSLFMGYHNNQTATENVFDQDRWFHTGDRGRIDSEGFLFLSGRLKDVIVLDSGKNVYPDELEHYYESSELIEEIGIFALKKSNSTVVAAVIVPILHTRSGSADELTEKIHSEMTRLAAGRPDYKRVAAYVISDLPLPRSSTKKIRKHLLPELYIQLEAGTLEQTTPLTAVQTLFMDSNEYKAVVDAVLEITALNIPGNEMTPNRELMRDFGIDSLRLLELVAFLEKQKSISIDERELVNVITLEDLARCAERSRDNSRSHNISAILSRACDSDEYQFNDKKGGIVRVWLWVIRNFSRMCWGLKIIGKDKIPADRPVIFAANHESMLDGLWLYSAIPVNIRKQTYIMIKAELTKSMILARLARGVNIISVEREGDIITPLRYSYAALKAGKNVAVFPEGTRSTDGMVHTFRSGIGILLRESNAIVVPVRIKNACVKWPKGKKPQFLSGWNPRPELIFGTPFDLNDIGLRDEADEIVISEAIRRKVVDVK